ncbi:DUF4192 family protein [Galbitalea sp. SE-J8]|uniref:DUF4192 family protein n=1 Tax=Galbitalea sp. SE-J8 TaxID=3054952 RepID=UPI00259CD6B2|nr:DUF4192 family protein [Galbitalea sp. SE-J8]MDM4764263.1 DUF4192 family protein [Galbitalea sp. SE-J8]
MSAPTVLRAHDAADLVAMVPILLPGAPLRASLVAMFFVGKRTYGGARIGLPPRRRTSDIRMLCRAITDCARKVPGVDGVAFVVYCDETFEAERGIPWLELGRTASATARRQQLVVLDVLCVAPDGWGSYLDHDIPLGGRPLEQIGSSPAALEAAVFAPEPVFAPVPFDLDPEQLAEPERARLTRLIDDYDTEVDRLLGLIGEGRALDALLPWDRAAAVERRLAAGAEGLEGRIATQFVETLQVPAERDAAMLQIAFGLDAGRAVRASNAVWERRRREHGGSMDDVMLAAIEAGENVDADGTASMMLGGAGRRPDRARVDRGMRLLLLLRAVASDDSQRPLLSMSAWLAWSIGRGSYAGEMLERLRAIDPGYGMLGVLENLLRYRPLPEWLFDVPLPRADDPGVENAGVENAGAGHGGAAFGEGASDSDA